jgi:hypothetical protein
MKLLNYSFLKKSTLVLAALIIGCSLIVHDENQLTGKPPAPDSPVKDSAVLGTASHFYKQALLAKQLKPASDSVEEGSSYNQVERMMMIWGDRIYPNGDCKNAANAINSYTNSYRIKSSDSRFLTGFVPQWTSLGPNGIPANTTGNQHGVGQMHRITFDPGYNGISNRKIYACSSYGGLWKTVNDGDSWTNMNTDLLPFCSVADVCINPQNTNQIFICTGYADDGFSMKYDPNWYHANPIFTIGLYRSNDGGTSWNPINEGFLPGFLDGGTCRRMIINPNNPKQIFVATTRGIYRCQNATSANPGWSIVLDAEVVFDLEFRGLAFKPNNPNIVYASGIDIYRSTDGGSNFQVITGPGTDLNFKNDPYFTVKRINITVSPANPERLYAYAEGYKTENGANIEGCKILIFEHERWTLINSQFNSGGGTNLFTSGYLGIAVSPINANQIYFGNTIVWGTDNYPALPFEKKADYFNSSGFHADVHDLKFQTIASGNPKLYCAHHGGISVKTIPASPAVHGWSYKSEGLSVATIWAFDDGDALSTFAMSANQDCGTNIYQGNNPTNKWMQIKGGDGYSARINDADPTLAFHSGGNNSFYRFKSSGTSYTTNTELNKLPPDPVYTGAPYVRVPKTFPMVNHPVTNKMIFGFTEIFERQLNVPTEETTIDQLWKLNSNIHQTINEDWKRQITEIIICPSNPDISYVVTGGQQNDPSAWQLQSCLFRGVSNPQNPAGPATFTEIQHPGKTISTIELAIITGIAVDPRNPNRIWISYTGYWNEFKVWHSENGGIDWVNADLSHSLFNIPVNAIIYQAGTKDRLFIGTDAGVYMSENGSPWQKFGKLPNVRVTEMKINKSINKLRVATYGRGLWEGTLPPAI